MPVIAAGSTSTHGAYIPIGYGSIPTGNTNTYLSFTNIPQGYQDLMVVISSRANTSTGTYLYSRINGVAYTGSWTWLAATGTTPLASYGNNTGSFAQQGWVAPNASYSGFYSQTVIHILNYANTTTYKTMISHSANEQFSSGTVGHFVTMHPLTAAITQLDFVCDGITAISSGTSFALYGVRSVNQ